MSPLPSSAGTCRLLFFTLATLTVVSGCRHFEPKRDSDLVKPLSSDANTGPRLKEPALPSDRELCLKTASVVAAKGHAAEAVKLYERAEQKDPTGATLDSELAPLYADIGNHDAAMMRYERLVQQSPEDVDLCNNHAWTLMEAGRLDDAIDEAKRGLIVDADHDRLRNTLAMIYHRKGDRDASLRAFSKSYDTASAHYNLALLDIDAGQMDLAKNELRNAQAASIGHSPADKAPAEKALAAIEASTLKR